MHRCRFAQGVLNEAVVSTVSDLALKVAYLVFRCLDQNGSKPNSPRMSSLPSPFNLTMGAA